MDISRRQQAERCSRKARLQAQLLRQFRIEHNKECDSRWRDTLEASIGQMNGRMGKWIGDEYSKLQGVTQTHGCKDSEGSDLKAPVRTHADKDCVAIAALGLGGTNQQMS
jgi:hypothetical protein